ncbi:type I restriction endonuclease subunit R, EcoR124 family, partial [Peptostreptococcus sp.]
WEQRKLGEISLRESTIVESSDNNPSVEYEDVVSDEGRLNKDIQQKDKQKNGIAFNSSHILYGKLRPYLHNWLNPDFNGAAVGDWWVLKPNTIDKNFLYRLIQTEQFDNVANQSSGSKMPRADWNLVSNAVFAIPHSIAEQSKIAKIFTNLDNLITLHQCKYNYLLRLKDCIFSIMVKTTWEQRKVGELGDVITGSTPSTNYSKYYSEDGIPWVTPTDINENITYDTPRKLSVEGQKVGRVVPKNTLLVTCIASIGKNTMLGEMGSFNQQINGLVPNFEKYDPFFLFTESSLWSQKMKREAAAGTMQIVNKTEFSNIETSAPELKEQQKIGNYFKYIDTLITLHQCKLKLLKQIKKSMENGLFIKNTTKKRKELENMTFKYESDFEETLINLLSNKGWEKDVIKYPTESELLQNWANILFDNNRGIDRLNNYPLTEGEMQQVLEQINSLRTPIKLNEFINGKTVSIKRDNPDDLEHLGKEISLKIYDRREIAAGQSRYQIVQQPVFPSKTKILNDRRGDLMLLINGMPVIHIELKKSGVPVSQACNQIEKYSKEGIFTGLFSLVQVFVAMTPNETRYFANPGPDGRFNSDYYFKWADFNNEPINDWKEIASSLLSIPMAHQLIGFYTIADESDGILKVMRSYQYYAANAISDKVAKIKWDESNQRGGFIWHTTGSGKTMTSFKSAQLIADSQEADKVVFLMDRIELGTQSLGEYRGFAGESKGISNEESSVKSTENTYTLISKLKSDSYLDTLIVTSIQKMSRIKDEEEGLKADDIEKINKKRIVFIVDEAHRSTFGEMLQTIKNTFPKSVFFGFTGTPIQDENEKKMSTTISVFGDELHRYSIADGIRDKNVLGFDIYKVMTFRDSDVRRSVAMERAKVKDRDDINFDERKKEIYFDYMDSSKIKMAGYTGDDGKYIKGVEDFLPNSQYAISEHRNKVIEDIADKWFDLSRGSKFHAILATSSIPEAIEYYHLFKEKLPWLKTTCLFDPNIDAKGISEKERDKAQYKQDGLVEIIDDYNKRYEQNFSLGTHAAFKKDLALRLAHKEYYKAIDRQPDKQLDLLIVVDQMLTGFDSKWVNTLYIDKMMEYENLIQAFSRTNRLFGPDKPFGTIRYYRKPHTMERNINQAVSLYSGNKSIGLFVNKIHKNIEKMNVLFADINELFKNANRADFSKLPDDKRVVAKFASLFKTLNEHLEAAKIQGFKWSNPSCEIEKENGEKELVTLNFDETKYLILVQRYKEIHRNDSESIKEDVPFYLEGYITEIDTGRIDSDYMNSRFEKYIKVLHNDEISREFKEDALNDLHNTFATLNQEEQKYANIFLHDLQRGDVFLKEGKTFRDYITDYQFKAKNDQIHRFAEVLGLDEEKLRTMMDLKLTESTIDEFGRLEVLKATKDKDKVKAYFQKKEGVEISKARANIKADKLIREFILKGGIDI